MPTDSRQLRERTRALIQQLGAQAEWKRGTAVQIAALLGIGPSLVSLLQNNRRDAGDVKWSTVQRIVASTGLREEFFLAKLDSVPRYQDYLPPGRTLRLGEASAVAPSGSIEVRAMDPRSIVAEILAETERDDISTAELAAVLAHVNQLARIKTVTSADAQAYLDDLRDEVDRQFRAGASHGGTSTQAAAKRRKAVASLSAAAPGASRSAKARKRRRRQA